MVNAQKIKFRIIEHEADIGLEIFGRSLQEIFIHGGVALFSLITDPDTCEARYMRKVAIDNGEDSLVVFLNELIYLWDTEKFLPCSFSVKEEREKIEVIMTGKFLDSSKHSVKKEIKAVTYHKFSIQQQGDLLKATIFLDI